MSAFLSPLHLLAPPAFRSARSSRRQSRVAVCSRAADSPAPSAAEAAALLPPWGVQPAVDPGTSVPHADAQWANFKLHLASWTGDWVYYDPSTGAPTKHLHSNRHLRLDAAGTAAVESVTHTNTLSEQFPAVDAPTREQSMRYSDTKPRPTWIQPIMLDGSLAPALGGECLFLPVTGGMWSDGSLADALFTERLVLHPHVPRVRLSIGARIAADGVRSLFLMREEEFPSRDAYLSSESGVYSRAMDARPLSVDEVSAAAAAQSEVQNKQKFVVVEHALSSQVMLSADVFMADAPPPLPVGDDRVALMLPDNIEISLPATTGRTAVGKPNAVHIRWKMDRGTWLHARTEFDAKGSVVGDRTAIYYPI